MLKSSDLLIKPHTLPVCYYHLQILSPLITHQWLYHLFHKFLSIPTPIKKKNWRRRRINDINTLVSQFCHLHRLLPQFKASHPLHLVITFEISALSFPLWTPCPKHSAHLLCTLSPAVLHLLLARLPIHCHPLDHSSHVFPTLLT